MAGNAVMLPMRPQSLLANGYRGQPLKNELLRNRGPGIVRLPSVAGQRN
jgi:hypothetical protein